MLTCSCMTYADADWYWNVDRDYSTTPTNKNRQRCTSCKKLIDKGAVAVAVCRSRPAKDPIEERIYGSEPDSVPMFTHFMCEECGDIHYSLEDLGFCVNPYDNHRNLLKEYQLYVEETKK